MRTLKVTIGKGASGLWFVRVQKTRRGENKVPAEEQVPREQLGAAIATVVKKTRGEGV